MEKKSKILIIGMSVFIVLSMFATFYRTIVAKDYPIVQDEKVTKETQ